MGIEVVEELVAAGRRVVVIDRAEAGRHHAKARALGVPVVIGDATETAVLDAANLAAATAVAVLTSDDLVNVETGLVLREQLGERLAVRAGGVAGVRPRAGARRRGGVRLPLRAVDGGAGRAVVRRRRARPGRARHVLRRPDAFLVGRLAVTAGGGLDGLAMRELAGRVRVVALHRADGGELEHRLRRDTSFAAGDEAYLVGRPDEVMQVLRRDAAGQPVVGVEMP